MSLFSKRVEATTLYLGAWVGQSKFQYEDERRKAIETSKLDFIPQ